MPMEILSIVMIFRVWVQAETLLAVTLEGQAWATFSVPPT
jgi:hypothetical protein